MLREKKIYESIKSARSKATPGEKTAELHLQFLKYAQDLSNVDKKAICEELGISKTYTAEIGKMRNIVDRLVKAGLDVNKI